MTQAHTQRKHARLAPSAAHRWMHCPGSVRLSEDIPNTTSSFAAEGTAAHEVCAKCLETGANASDFAGMWVDVKTGTIVDTPEDTDEADRFFEIDDEMVDGVQMYVDHVCGLHAGASDFDEEFSVEVEQRLDMTHLHPEIFGTGDATVFDYANRHLHVIDFKYGKGVAVDATDNPQLLLYAAGAARRHHNAQIEHLTMHIVQPRAPHALGPVRSYAIDLLDLFEFEDKLAEAAKATDTASSDMEKVDCNLIPQKLWDTVHLKAGEHCRFCPAQPVCPAVRQKVLQAAAEEFGDLGDAIGLTPPEELTDERMALVLKEADQIGNYVKAVQEYAHAQAMAGKTPAGFKLVAKRAFRKWINEDAARHHLYDLGATNDDILTEPKMKSPAQLEKLFPGKNKAEREKAMADLVEKKSSGLNLVPIEDPRPAAAVGASSDFDAVSVD